MPTIELDDTKVMEAVQANIGRVVSDAIQSYSMRKALEDQLAGSVLAETVGKAVNSAISSLSESDLANTIARNIQRAVASAMHAVILDACTSMICKLRGCEYDDAKRQRIRAELEAAMKEKAQ